MPPQAKIWRLIPAPAKEILISKTVHTIVLLDLLKIATDGSFQVVTTTHSPAMLAKVDDEAFEDVAVVCRRSDTHNAVIRRLADLPDAHELRNSQGMDRLHTSGWMEDIIDFDDEEQVAA